MSKYNKNTKYKVGDKVVVVNKSRMLSRLDTISISNRHTDEILQNRITHGFTPEMHKLCNNYAFVISAEGDGTSGIRLQFVESIGVGTGTYKFSNIMLSHIQGNTLNSKDKKVRVALSGIYPKFVKARLSNKPRNK